MVKQETDIELRVRLLKEYRKTVQLRKLVEEARNCIQLLEVAPTLSPWAHTWIARADEVLEQEKPK